MINKLFTLFLFSTIFVFGQDNKEKPLKEKISITLSPLSLIDIFDGSSLRIGAEKQLSKNVSAHFEPGFYLGNVNVYKRNPKGFLYKVGINYCINRDLDEDSFKYIGIEYQYKNQDYEYVDSFAVNTVRFEKQYKMNRKMNCISLKYGVKYNSDGHFYSDMFLGLGVRFMNSTNNLSQQENDGLLSGEENGSTQADSILTPIGNYGTINFIFGFKIGYRIF